MKIRTEDAIKHFPDGVAGLAAALEITRAAIYQWGDLVPETRVYQLHHLSEGKLPPPEDAVAAVERSANRDVAA